MLKVAFVLAALLATEGAVFSLPVINARGYESSDIVPRAEPGIIQRRASDPPIGIGFVPTEDLYNQIVDSLVPLKQPTQPTVTVTVAARDLSDQEDIEARGYWDEDENHLARRGLDDGLMKRDYDGELVPRGGRHRGRGRKQALPPAPAAPLQAEAAKQPYSTADPPTEGNGAGETAGPDDMVDKFVKHPRVQELARQGIDRVLTG